MKKIILSSFCMFAMFSQAQTWVQTEKLVASDRGVNDKFGEKVAISGNYAIVGAPFESEDVSGSNTMDAAGSAYIYELNGSGQWVQKQKIVASDRVAYDNFGNDVSINGNYAIIGSPSNGTGSAYIFERDGSGNWNQVQKLLASDGAANDFFGSTVSITDNYAIISAPFEDEDESGSNMITNAGSAYIFSRSGSTWTQQQKIVASDRTSTDRFGMSGVSINGTYAIIGCRFDGGDVTNSNELSQAGSSYIFEMTGTSWSQAAKICAPDREAGAYFGAPVSINGDYAVIGAFGESKDVTGANPMAQAGAAYVYVRTSGVWSAQQKLIASDRAVNNNFGYGVSMSGDKLVVGSRGATVNAIAQAGSAYLFERTGTVWSEYQKVTANDKDTNDMFGNSVGISGDVFIVGASNEDHDATGGALLNSAGSVYMFGMGCGVDPTVTTGGTTITSNQIGANYQWIDCNNSNNPIAGETGQSYTATATGSYAVIVDIGGGCIDTSACQTITIVGLDNIALDDAISVYPNPSNGEFTINSQMEANLKVTDLTGRVVSERGVSKGKNIVRLNENNGVYLLVFSSDSKTFTKRILIK